MTTYKEYLKNNTNDGLKKMFPLRRFENYEVDQLLELYNLNQKHNLDITTFTIKSFEPFQRIIQSMNKNNNITKEDIINKLSDFPLDSYQYDDVLLSLDLISYAHLLNDISSISLQYYWNNNEKNLQEGLTFNPDQKIFNDIDNKDMTLQHIVLELANQKCELGITALNKDAAMAILKFDISVQELRGITPEQKFKIQEKFLQYMLQPENKAILQCIDYRSYFWVWARYLKEMVLKVVLSPLEIIKVLKDAFINFVYKSEDLSKDLNDAINSSYYKDNKINISYISNISGDFKKSNNLKDI